MIKLRFLVQIFQHLLLTIMIQKVGAVAVPLNIQLKGTEVAYHLSAIRMLLRLFVFKVMMLYLLESMVMKVLSKLQLANILS